MNIYENYSAKKGCQMDAVFYSATISSPTIRMVFPLFAFLLWVHRSFFTLFTLKCHPIGWSGILLCVNWLASF